MNKLIKDMLDYIGLWLSIFFVFGVPIVLIFLIWRLIDIISSKFGGKK
jgi:hypothetical protein